MPNEHIPTLKRLRDKLSDLSMRNRSLRLIRLPKKRAFDLAWLDKVHPGDSSRVLERVLSGRKQTVAILAVGTDDEDAQAIHKGLTYLDREVRLVEAERGVYDLSVGFLFLCGSIGDKKYIQAPVFLFPRRLILERKGKNGTRWLLQPPDDPKEINVNRTLLLALHQYADISVDIQKLEDKVTEILLGTSRSADWLSQLAAAAAKAMHGLGLRSNPTAEVWGVPVSISATQGPQLVPTLPLYKAAEVPEKRRLDFELRPHAVLSRFPLADTALLDDYDRLKTVLEVNPSQRLGYAGELLGAQNTAEGSGGGNQTQVNRTAAKPPNWHITSTDESQQAVLGQVLSGTSLAVYGPPGTGKSQLIANLVSSALAAGKSVLVVSQKRPALDVVAQRLGDELSRFVALVHDPIRDRTQFCERIISSLAPNLGHGGTANAVERNRLIKIVSAEEKWFEEVHKALTTDGKQGSSPFEAYVYKLQYPGKPKVLSVRQLPKLTPSELVDALPDLLSYVDDIQKCRTPQTWKQQRPDFSARTLDHLEEFTEQAMPKVLQAVKALHKWELSRPTSLPELGTTVAQESAYVEIKEWCAQGTSLPSESWQWVARFSGIQNPVQQLQLEVNAVANLLRLRTKANDRILEHPTQVNEADTAIARWEELNQNWYKLLQPEWYQVQKAVRLFLDNEGVAAEAHQAGIQEWRCRKAYHSALLTTPKQLKVLAFNNTGLRRLSQEDLQNTQATATPAATLVTNWNGLSNEAHTTLGEIPTSAAQVKTEQKIVVYALRAPGIQATKFNAIHNLEKWLGPVANTWFSEVVKSGHTADLTTRFDKAVAAHFHDLVAADRRMNSVSSRHSRLIPLVKMLKGLQSTAFKTELWTAYSERWARDAESGAGNLVDLTQSEATRRRKRLTDAWHALPRESQNVLKAKLHDQVATITVRERTELLKRAEQRRRRWPIRKMVEAFWSKGLGSLIPVWLCSPETVASVFPLTPGYFDFVVFDEASQCTLAQGLTVVYRGKTCVIAGDEQQLPPSNLFSTTLEDEDDMDEVIDEESLLSRAKNTGNVMSLAWHYRSKYPELIQFSNSTFYHGGLRVSPVPVTGFKPPAVEWIRVPGEWTKRANEAESELAVELLSRYLKEHPEESVGIITLNRQQSDFIQDTLDQRLEKSPSLRDRYGAAMESDLDSRPFIRNLENVQGDERDVIIISVAYSANASGNVPLRFGTLNRPGGERRLNVAVSRARKKMIILCSFDPASQMQVSDGTSVGARTLQAFLCYAQEAGIKPQAIGSGTVAMHHAHESVVDELERKLTANGWFVDKALGASAARVDIAVRSKTAPDRHILGIVIDGPGASWAKTAIGREVGRIDYLKLYNWPVHVLSIRGLVRNDSAVFAELLERLNLEESRSGDIPAPPSVAIPIQKAAVVKPIVFEPSPASPLQPAANGRQASLPLPKSARAAQPPSGATPVAPPIPRPMVVEPGSKVTYKLMESNDERTVVLAGPSIPRSIDVVRLNVPLAEALLEAAVGDITFIEFPNREVELKVLSIHPPPPMPM
jgi:RecA/RadA recombinase